MSYVSVTISGGLLEASTVHGQEVEVKLFAVRTGAYGTADGYLHLTKKEAAQWAAVLNEYAEEAE